MRRRKALLLYKQAELLSLLKYVVRIHKLKLKNREIGVSGIQENQITKWWRSFKQVPLIDKKLRGLSPQANYTDRAAAAGRQS